MEVYFTATYEKTVDFIVKVPDGKFTKGQLKKLVSSGEIFDVGQVVGEDWVDDSFQSGALNEIIFDNPEPKKEA